MLYNKSELSEQYWFQVTVFEYCESLRDHTGPIPLPDENKNRFLLNIKTTLLLFTALMVI